MEAFAESSSEQEFNEDSEKKQTENHEVDLNEAWGKAENDDKWSNSINYKVPENKKVTIPIEIKWDYENIEELNYIFFDQNTDEHGEKNVNNARFLYKIMKCLQMKLILKNMNFN